MKVFREKVDFPLSVQNGADVNFAKEKKGNHG